MKYVKKDENTLQVITPVKTAETKQEAREYNISFLQEQVEAITKQRDEMIALKEAELAEVQTLLSEAKKLSMIKISQPLYMGGKKYDIWYSRTERLTYPDF